MIEKKSEAGFMYADNLCLMASNKQDLCDEILTLLQNTLLLKS